MNYLDSMKKALNVTV